MVEMFNQMRKQVLQEQKRQEEEIKELLLLMHDRGLTFKDLIIPQKLLEIAKRYKYQVLPKSYSQV